MDDETETGSGAFDFLTARQKAVLDLLVDNRTSKEIGYALGISETAVNRRIEVLRSRLGGVTRQELARRYRDWIGGQPTISAADPACVDNGLQILQLAAAAGDGETALEDGPAADRAFQDSLALRIDAPWTRPEEPQVVPGVLDGKHATLARGAIIAFILFAGFASVVLGLAIAFAITAVLGT